MVKNTAAVASDETRRGKEEEEEELLLLQQLHNSIQSRTDNANLLDWENEEERRTKIMSLVMQTLASAAEPLSPWKLLQMNKGLIHVLQIIDQSPKGQISTRKLLEAINSGDLHKLIKKGEKLGFIERKKVKKPQGQKGNNMVVNSLTLKGHMLLEVYDMLSGHRHEFSPLYEQHRSH
jgi:DNA-binding MarR family transcriptional regulator